MKAETELKLNTFTQREDRVRERERGVEVVEETLRAEGEARLYQVKLQGGDLL